MIIFKSQAWTPLNKLGYIWTGFSWTNSNKLSINLPWHSLDQNKDFIHSFIHSCIDSFSITADLALKLVVELVRVQFVQVGASCQSSVGQQSVSNLWYPV